MSDKFCLSSKRYICDEIAGCMEQSDETYFEGYFKEEDVKEFIRLLKKDLNEVYFTSDEQMNKTYAAMVRLRIDKLAGEKLL